MKRVAIYAVAAILLTTMLSSCMTTKTSVGAYKEQSQTGDKYLYAKGKQMWLFWGIVPLGRTSVSTPSDGHCQVVTKRNVADVLIGGLTGGIVSTYSIRIYAIKKPQIAPPAAQ